MKGLDELKKQVLQGGLSRREFMQRAAALGVAAGASSAMFSSAAQASMPPERVAAVMPHSLSCPAASTLLDSRFQVQ